MPRPPVSIVIASRHRPDALMRCLTGVAQLDHAPFEVIVVACPAGISAVSTRADVDHLKLVPFDEANVSVARNLGIAQAAGEIVAFLDDDAVPEPLWLHHLTAPFAQGAAAAGGYVIGRNGISFQWTARSVGVTGAAAALEMPGNDPAFPDPGPGRVVKTEGTNMAVRRDVLADLGGFDPAFRFYLDETDLNLRLAARGHATALVPLAQVHHGIAASSRRGANRAPRDLTEIGASKAVFLRKHCPKNEHYDEIARFSADQRRRLLRYMQNGLLGPDDVIRLMRGLRRGLAEGADRPLGTGMPLSSPPPPLRPYPAKPGAERKILAGRPWQAQHLRRTAAKMAQDGACVSLFLFSPTTLYHSVRFTKDGVWEQCGGLFGRSDRAGPLFQRYRFAKRVQQEGLRVAVTRGHLCVTRA